MSHKQPASEDFVDVFFGDQALPHLPSNPHGSHGNFYDDWKDEVSAKVSSPTLIAADAIRKRHPGFSMVSTDDWTLSGAIFSFPGASLEPLKDIPTLSSLYFRSLPVHRSPVPGVLLDSISFGGFKLYFEAYELLLYTITYPHGFGDSQHFFILYDGPEDVIRGFLLTAGIWANALHDEIWVFDQGYWSKRSDIFYEVMKADWDEIILDPVFKKALRTDVNGFFSSEDIYKKLKIPWKRGLIMHGPPGNGKTISIKAIMKDCITDGHAPLYVRSFHSWMGEEGAMQEVFDKARELAPCVVILEDLDSLINDGNRSFFLNQLDGLTGNDGLLVIGTTNHFDRLDPGISTRPSRFDRKFLFDDPNQGERALYAQYWQDKLSTNKDIDFPDQLVQTIAEVTDKFSFAYLKEAFVSTLVLLAGYESKEKPSFATVIGNEIKILRKQLDKSTETTVVNSTGTTPTTTAEQPPHQNPNNIRVLFDNLSDNTAQRRREQDMWRGQTRTSNPNAHGAGPQSFRPMRAPTSQWQTEETGAHTHNGRLYRPSNVADQHQTHPHDNLQSVFNSLSLDRQDKVFIPQRNIHNPAVGSNNSEPFPLPGIPGAWVAGRPHRSAIPGQFGANIGPFGHK